jgi:hypothetical protein
VDTVANYGPTVRRATGGLSWISPGQILAVLAFAGIAWFGFRMASIGVEILEARLKDARSGANIGR